MACTVGRLRQLRGRPRPAPRQSSHLFPLTVAVYRPLRGLAKWPTHWRHWEPEAASPRRNNCQEAHPFPIVVHRDQVSVSIPKFENRIDRGSTTPKIASEGRSHAPPRRHQPTLRPHNNASNHDIRLRPNKATRADVAQLTGNPRIVQVIELDQGHTGSAAIATDNRGIESGSRVMIMADSSHSSAQTVVDERLLAGLAIVHPVVVGRNDGVGRSCRSRTGSARPRQHQNRPGRSLARTTTNLGSSR